MKKLIKFNENIDGKGDGLLNSRLTKNLFMNTLKIPRFETIYELSRITGLSTRVLFCLSKKNYNYYRRFTIPKKSGKKRIIYAPSYSMAIMQKWILRNILDKVAPSNKAMAFRRGDEFGCKTNAKLHMDTLFGLCLDLENFFPCIKANKVFCLFRDLGYNNFAATILTKICTLNGEIPQGGVCSPSISNLICIPLDKRLTGLCEKRGIRYTRYADDMYFSCDNKDLLVKTFPIIREIICDEDFRINDSKTRFQTPYNRKYINGITIVKAQQVEGFELKAKKKLKGEVRASIHKAILTGDYNDKERILGLISYIHYIEKGNKKNYLDSIKKYINHTSQKIIFFEELVCHYNKNLFYNDLNPIEHKDLSVILASNIFLEDEDIDLLEELSYSLDERKKYLKKLGYKDICKYKDWPDLSNSIVYDGSSPF